MNERSESVKVTFTLRTGGLFTKGLGFPRRYQVSPVGRQKAKSSAVETSDLSLCVYTVCDVYAFQLEGWEGLFGIG